LSLKFRVLSKHFVLIFIELLRIFFCSFLPVSGLFVNVDKNQSFRILLTEHHPDIVQSPVEIDVVVVVDYDALNCTRAMIETYGIYSNVNNGITV